MSSFTDPAAVMGRLEEIDRDLAERQNEYEQAALDWYRAKRTKEHDRAVAFIAAVGSVAERNAIADRDTSHIGMEAEASYESLKAVVRVLETRASIGQSLLKAQGRA